MALLDEHVSGKIDHNYRLWLLLNLELWHQLFLDGRSEEDLKDHLQKGVLAARHDGGNGSARATAIVGAGR